MADQFMSETQKQLMSIPGAFTSLATHIPQLLGLTGTIWIIRRVTDGLDNAYGVGATSGYSGLSLPEQFFRSFEEGLSFVVKLKYSKITGLDQVADSVLTK